MENGSEDGFLEFPSAMTSSGDEEILEVEFEEEEDMEEFEMAKFEELMYKLKNRKELISTLTILRTIRIPPSIVRSEQLIDRIEGFLYHKEAWFSAMLLIRKLEKKDGNFAPKLKESIEMKEMWKEARIRKMRDEQWVKDFERERVRAKERREEWKRRDRIQSYSDQRSRNKKMKFRRRPDQRIVESYSNGWFGAVKG